MPETRIEIELRCKRHLHGVLHVLAYILDLGEEARAGIPANIVQVSCQQCRREVGRTVVHQWRTLDAMRLPDREERDNVAA
ncbi:MAG: hypothetical protein ACR2OU_17420 [Thermomicrobiales bacterium]